MKNTKQTKHTHLVDRRLVSRPAGLLRETRRLPGVHQSAERQKVCKERCTKDYYEHKIEFLSRVMRSFTKRMYKPSQCKYTVQTR